VGDQELVELMHRYVIKGLSDWCDCYGLEARRDKARDLQLRISESREEAVAVLYRNGEGTAVEFIPVPYLDAPKIEWAFFSPRRERDSTDGWVFDLFLLLEGGGHIGFRLEPADGFENGRHEFSHVQLSWRFGHKQVEPAGALKWLPDSYPAFPLPGYGSLDRFLMLVVALHGFPGGTEVLLRELVQNRPARARELEDRLSGLLSRQENGGSTE